MLSERQLAAFADKHAWQIPFDTSPRHLAGPGDARHVTHGLAAAGWSPISDPLSAEIVLRSPDYRYHIQFDPQSATSAWWRLRAESADIGPGWYAEFGELVPAEVLSGLTDALVAPPPAEQPDVWQTVRSAGWTHNSEGTAHSADGMCVIELRQSEFHKEPAWQVETRETGFDGHPGRRIWHAAFHEGVPVHLVNAFVTALADPAPLQRAMFDRTAHYRVVQQPSPLAPQQTVDTHTTRIDSLRAQARSARRQTKPATPPAKAKTTQPAHRR
ncbi:DUF317 domain-containing protein [Streptomyces sp. NPDC059604]|uniref:DUF317 domain-containing protein n=1 Tax=Streptomyces sp. NPDC059604 TaxID=3346881 RepID=UPI0036919278